MRARLYDGQTTAAQACDLEVAGGVLRFEMAGEPRLWPVSEIEVEALGPDVRLTRRGAPERLIVQAAAWRMSSGRTRAADRWRAFRLLAVLAAGGMGILLSVFVGLPLAAGPLARATPPDLEHRMGQSLEAQMTLAFPPCRGEPGQMALQALGTQLGEVSDSPFPIRVRAVEAEMVNAFALPGGTILVTGGLIDAAEPDELAAVIAHEVAHVEQRHAMEALWRSVGLGLVLDAVVGGGTGVTQQTVLLAGAATDMRHSRQSEGQADARGQALLHALGLSSTGMATFFDQLAQEETAGEDEAAGTIWAVFESHPASRARAEASQARARAGRPGFTSEAWAAIGAACDRESERPGRGP